MIEKRLQCDQTCSSLSRLTLIPSLLASNRIACLTTAVCVMPSCSESLLSKTLSVSLNRMVVVFFIMLDIVAHLVYNASTWKPMYLGMIGVSVVASSRRKFACGVGSSGLSNQVKLPAMKQVLKRGVSRFITF